MLVDVMGKGEHPGGDFRPWKLPYNRGGMGMGKNGGGAAQQTMLA